MAPSAQELAETLREGAHGDAGIQQLRAAVEPLSADERIDFLNSNILTPPLDQATANARAGRELPAFNVLQGDVITTSAGYLLGVRQPDHSYVIASSTCDVQPGRRQTALLFAVGPQRRGDFATMKEARGKMKPLTLYKPKQFFYLPPLPDDAEDVLFNVAYLDPLYTIANEAVNLASRRASMSTFGWRLFGVVTRELLVREADMEEAMRNAMSARSTP